MPRKMTTLGTADSEARIRTGRPITGSRVRPLTLRLVLSLALFPIVPSSSLLLMAAIGEYWASSLSWFDEIQFWMLSGTVAITFASLWIWHACVVWTAGRYAGTVVATAIPIAQVLWWQPLWNVGCAEDVLKVYQSTTLVGFWVWATVWAWWGWTRIGLGKRWRIRMTNSAKRVLLSFGLLPVIVGGYWITGIFIHDVLLHDDDRLVFCADVLVAAVVLVLSWLMLCTPIVISTARQRIGGCVGVLLCSLPLLSLRLLAIDWSPDTPIFTFLNTLWAIVAVLLWFLIWRSTVVWSWGVRLRTELAAIVFVGIAFGANYIPNGSDTLDALRYMLPTITWGGWMIATVLFWRYRETTTTGGIDENLRCPSCGYSLRGLYGTRCPECGSQPTLDELFVTVVGAGDA